MIVGSFVVQGSALSCFTGGAIVEYYTQSYQQFVQWLGVDVSSPVFPENFFDSA